MHWLEEAYKEIITGPIPKLSAKYSGKFKGYNANVKYRKNWMEFSLSKNWQSVDEDIQKGVVQHLLARIFNIKTKTLSIKLYEEFLRQASEYAQPGESDQYLVDRFKILNEQYFDGLLIMPTLTFGSFSTTRLGTYEYATDTIKLSTALKENEQMLDYVLYHELLHKKHKFTCSGARTHHHTKAFKADEALFHVPNAEKELEHYIAIQRKKKPKKIKMAKQKKKGILSWFS